MNTYDKSQFASRIRQCARRLRHEGVGALGPLFDLTAHRLVRYALMLTRHQQDAEDALQAAMVKIALNPRVLAKADNPWAYFLKVVRNEALRILRKKRPAELLPAAHSVDHIAAPAADSDDLRHYIRDALGKLPPSQAEVVVLKIWESMTFAEIGEVLGQSPNTIASRYRYALEKLTRHLQPLSDEVRHE